ncbi:amine acid ABC transporter, permease protein, 3-TM region, His/Glu/Gln/Arg/opine family [Rhizobium leguminosarum bv. trifolii WSM597]|uniref:Amine acid ABC transporter, permease protein, 3-TM region, His/Glu/Gln/Arg/opine family n=1 Tax=Rhizobium leguminosarum bv. trifolii WSM597 TaxID=754764 RepID=I9NGG4_RHILT|nr:amino acid ABC transporter permease [Rhizobium leguminosarum]EJB07039.1 amine acid ABC transporter, permease protein, 3-TM region, His/Glu/Gln/Arg/opine family [Rhizobium leguminosarum bv. trifolii WSM597]
MEILDFGWIGEYRDLLLAGLLTTVWITMVGGFAGFIIGLACAWCRIFGPSGLRPLPSGYVELIRNTPFLVQLYFIYFALPSMGVSLSATAAAMLAIIINFGAYGGEIIRAGIEATPKGQFEAGASLAMLPGQVFRHIVLKPALARIWPALTSQLILVMFGSAVVSQISVEDLTYAANFIQSRNFRALETYVVATLAYLFLATLLRQLMKCIGWLFLTRRVKG